MEDDDESNGAPERSFAETLALVATQRGTLENVKDDTGECEGPAEPAAPLREEAVTRHGFHLHASPTIAASDDLARERLCRYGLRPPFALSRFRVLRDGRISYRVKTSARRSSRCRIMTPVDCIARLCAFVPPPRYPLTHFHGVLAPRAKLRPRIVPMLPPNATRPCVASRSTPNTPNQPSSPLRKCVLRRPPVQAAATPSAGGVWRAVDDGRFVPKAKRPKFRITIAHALRRAKIARQAAFTASAAPRGVPRPKKVLMMSPRLSAAMWRM